MLPSRGGTVKRIQSVRPRKWIRRSVPPCRAASAVRRCIVGRRPRGAPGTWRVTVGRSAGGGSTGMATALIGAAREALGYHDLLRNLLARDLKVRYKHS